MTLKQPNIFAAALGGNWKYWHKSQLWLRIYNASWPCVMFWPIRLCAIEGWRRHRIDLLSFRAYPNSIRFEVSNKSTRPSYLIAFIEYTQVSAKIISILALHITQCDAQPSIDSAHALNSCKRVLHLQCAPTFVKGLFFLHQTLHPVDRFQWHAIGKYTQLV